MKIIITMAGEGSRFKKIGFKVPKHEIIAKEKSLFEWSLLSLKDFFAEEFIFLVREGNYSLKFLNEICKNLGIERYKIKEIKNLTDGQGTTAYLADEYLVDEDEICIYNIDTYIKEFEIKKIDLINSDGFIPVFEAEGDKWSFIKVNNENKIVEVSEKIRISNLGTIGFYHFKKWKDYKAIYKLFKEEIKKEFKEMYIAPMYKYMIEEDKKLTYKIISRDNFFVLGTPEDIERFDKNYIEENKKKNLI